MEEKRCLEGWDNTCMIEGGWISKKNGQMDG